MKFVDDIEANSDFSNDDLEPEQVPVSSSSAMNQPKNIVTCTVTTGLTQNGFNNGSLLGFTLSIPSTSLTSTPVSTLSSGSGSGGPQQQNGIQRKENLSSPHSTASSQALTKINNPSKTSTVQDVDEDYDDC